jgi:hypothetical protein
MVAFENYHYNICVNRMTKKLEGEVKTGYEKCGQAMMDHHDGCKARFK